MNKALAYEIFKELIKLSAVFMIGILVGAIWAVDKETNNEGN